MAQSPSVSCAPFCTAAIPRLLVLLDYAETFIDHLDEDGDGNYMGRVSERSKTRAAEVAGAIHESLPGV